MYKESVKLIQWNLFLTSGASNILKASLEVMVNALTNNIEQFLSKSDKFF